MTEQIDQFFAPNGRLKSIPVKPAKKIAVLTEIAKQLSPDTKSPDTKSPDTKSPDTKSPEKELNPFIAADHPDTAAIR